MSSIRSKYSTGETSKEVRYTSDFPIFELFFLRVVFLRYTPGDGVLSLIFVCVYVSAFWINVTCKISQREAFFSHNNTKSS